MGDGVGTGYGNGQKRRGVSRENMNLLCLVPEGEAPAKGKGGSTDKGNERGVIEQKVRNS